jgi:hypothetical protein
MSQQTINQGNPPIVWSTIDDAFQKINANFTELYLSIGGSGVDLSNIAADLIPDTTLTRDLGSLSRRWRDLYLSGSSLYLGDALITADLSGAVNLPPGSTVGGSLIKDPTNVSFGQISVSGQSDVLANTETGVLYLSGSNISITTNPSTDTITFTNTGVTALTGSSGISVSSATGAITLTNTGVTSVAGSTGISVSSATGSVTFTNTGVTSVVTDPGSGISLDASTGTVNISNSAPNIIQPVHRFIAVQNNTTLDAVGPNSTLTFASGSGVIISTDPGTNSVIIGLQDRLDIKGSVFSDDSTLLVDSVNGIIPAEVVQGTFTGNVKGSIFADDSTQLVDGNSSTIYGNIQATTLRTAETKIALGTSAGEITQGADTVAVGNLAGRTNQAANGVAIGALSGVTNQGAGAVAVGSAAGNTGQGFSGVAIGYAAGGASQGQRGIAIGDQAGSTNQGDYAVAIGSLSGGVSQGANSIAIGQNAGVGGTNANSIILNATGLALTSAAAGFYVDPIRSTANGTPLMYNTSTKELFSSSVLEFIGSTISTNDSSGITIDVQTTFNTDVTFENDITVAERLTVNGSRVINLTELKSVVAASANFADFQTRIAAL